jgi:FKBP-type peptidyl-prolyl cis-trans isomerase FkpA
MNKSLIFSAFALFLTVSATAQAPRFRIVKHTQKSVPAGISGLSVSAPPEKQKVVSGDKVTLDVYVFLKDSVIQTSRSQGRPVEFQMPTPEQMAGRPVPAIVAGLFDMVEGDSISTYELIDSVGQQLPPEFAGQKEIRMDIALHKVVGAAEMAKIEAEKAEKGKLVIARAPKVGDDMKIWLDKYAKNTWGDQLKTAPNGLKYVILETGKGAPLNPGENIAVQYWGSLPDGKRFDDSFSRGEPIEFPVGQGAVIPGWDSGLMLLNHGSKAIFFIPSELGYGAQGAGADIPPNSELVFYVELQ